MKSTPIRNLDRIMIQTEKETKWIHLTDVTRIQEEPWLDRFGNWGSLHFKDGTIEYFCVPSVITVYEYIKTLQQNIKTLQQIQVRAERSRGHRKSFGKSTSENDERSRVTPKKKLGVTVRRDRKCNLKPYIFYIFQYKYIKGHA